MLLRDSFCQLEKSIKPDQLSNFWELKRTVLIIFLWSVQFKSLVIIFSLKLLFHLFFGKLKFFLYKITIFSKFGQND